MTSSTPVNVLAIFSIILSLIGTVWTIARPIRDQGLITLEMLAERARPLRMASWTLLLMACGTLAVAFVLFLISDTKSTSGLLILVTIAFGLFCTFVNRYVNRFRAFEEIVKRSLPDLYSEINSTKG